MAQAAEHQGLGLIVNMSSVSKVLCQVKELRAKSPHLVELSRVILLGVVLPLKVKKESQQWQESNLLGLPKSANLVPNLHENCSNR